MCIGHARVGGDGACVCWAVVYVLLVLWKGLNSGESEGGRDGRRGDADHLGGGDATADGGGGLGAEEQAGVEGVEASSTVCHQGGLDLDNLHCRRRQSSK